MIIFIRFEKMNYPALARGAPAKGIPVGPLGQEDGVSSIARYPPEPRPVGIGVPSGISQTWDSINSP